ncbi:MAG: Uncharacterised protein [Rhodobiaceae bacterium UBA7378]|nr:MAG: Uncharacterised protein [Rhodobiaceae bacterium UBA7378]
MSFYLLMTAAAVCFLAVAAHGIWGRKIYLGLIDKTILPAREKSISAVSWDVFTIMLSVSGLSLLFVAFNRHAILMAYPIMAIHLMGACLFFFFMAKGHKELVALPGAYLMGAIGVLTLLAIQG